MPESGDFAEADQYGIHLQPDPADFTVIVLGGLGSASQTGFRIKTPRFPWPLVVVQNLASIPISFRISSQEHAVLETLVGHPNQLLLKFKQMIEKQNLPALKIYIDWFFQAARNAILREILRQLRLPPRPPRNCVC